MVITVTHCWASESRVALVCALADLEAEGSLLRAVTKTPTLSKWSVSAAQATKDLSVRNVPLVIMVTLRYQEGGATHVSVTEISTCRTLNHATPALAPVSNACFTPMAMRASTVDVVTMETPVHRSAGDVCAILWEVPGTAVLMTCVSVTGLAGSAHAFLVWRVRPVTVVPPTHGTSTVAKDANIASATQNTRIAPPATCCQVSVPVRLVLEAGHVMSAGNCSGEILRSSATHVTVTHEALPLNSVIRCLASVCA